MRTICGPFAVLSISLLVASPSIAIGLGEEIHDAAREGDVAKVKELLRADPRLANAVDDTLGIGYTPLHWAAERGHKDVVEVLLTAGADISAKNGHGGTPLHTAVWNANEDVSKLLLSRGAKLDIFTMAGLGLKDRLALLLDKDRKLVDAKDPEERTPLHWAA